MSAPSRQRAQESVRAASELARSEFLRAYQWNEALRAMRPLVADINGTAMEKRFFHRFRGEAADGMTAHICNFSNFWARVAPQVSHNHEAVKHAVVALGAAHELFTFPNAQEISGFPRERIEVFVIKQYNESIAQLSRYVASTSTENIHVTITCCLIFICLETLRQNHQGAVTHLMNGLKILQSLPPCSLNFLAETEPWRPSTSASFDVEETGRLFSQMEISASFASGIRPILCETGYSYRRFWTSEDEPEFADLQAAHHATCLTARDAAGRLHETMGASEDEGFWADPQQVEQQRCLRERVGHLARRLADFQRRQSPLPKGSHEQLYILLDRVHVECIRMMMQFIDENAHKCGAAVPVPATGFVRERNTVTVEILKLVTKIQRGGAGKSWLRRPDEDRRSFVIDTGIRGPLYVVTIGARNERLRQKALSMLAEDEGQEGFWDGKVALNRMVIDRAAATKEGERRKRDRDEREHAGQGSTAEVPDDLLGSEFDFDFDSDFDLDDLLADV